MKQKASLVISLVHDPEFIIFDEPTNGLDVLTAKVVTDFLLHLRDTGHTIIVSTHIFSLDDKICDRVGIILDGHMVTCGEKAVSAAGKTWKTRFLTFITTTPEGSSNEKQYFHHFQKGDGAALRRQKTGFYDDSSAGAADIHTVHDYGTFDIQRHASGGAVRI